MSAVNPLPILLVLIVAMATVWLLDRRFPMQMPTQRVDTIEGLRGYLAVGVFLHHGCVWHYYMTTGAWANPPSRLYAHLGQTSVSLFFMITGFLFFARLLDARAQHLDWTRLYISRFLRIVPLLAVMTVVVLILHVLVRKTQLFSVDAVKYGGTALMQQLTAGVRWTLNYEWRFYFALPLLALLLRRSPPWAWVAVSLLYLGTGPWHQLVDIHAATFLGGMAAAWLIRYESLREFACRPVGSACALIMLGAAVFGFDTAYAVWPTLLLSGAFILMTCGAHLFGLLAWRSSHLLGQITFGVYLLHGTSLFILFRLLVGYEAAGQLSPVQHWLLIVLWTPVLVGLAYAAFKWVEEPAMGKTQALTQWVKQFRGLRWLTRTA